MYRFLASILMLATPLCLVAQQPTPMERMMSPQRFVDSVLNHITAGTSAEPVSTPMPMQMKHSGQWMLMLHGSAFITDTQQSGPRGSDKLFSTNWIMPMAQRKLGPGQLTLRTMFSLEPATITGRKYPELFQQGETAYGQPIIDGQHPHDFFMEVAALYDLQPSPNTVLTLYAAPIGDPAIGPTAYPHRWSAAEDPIATLGHHQQDSTHLAFNVFTLGLTYRWLRIEESGFHGGEPNESRWSFQPSSNGHAIDSYSTRITANPTRNLSAQYSIAHITSPEPTHPDEDQQRQTASIMYNLPLGLQDMMNTSPGNLALSLIWGRTKSLPDSSKQNSYTLEALYQFTKKNSAWTRIELASRTSELLSSPHELPIGHTLAYTFGYDRDFQLTPYLTMAPGAQFTAYSPSPGLRPTYGSNPFAVQAFLRFRITSN